MNLFVAEATSGELPRIGQRWVLVRRSQEVVKV